MDCEFEVSVGYSVRSYMEKGSGGVQDLEEEPGARRRTVKKTEQVWGVFGSQSSTEQAQTPESQ